MKIFTFLIVISFAFSQMINAQVPSKNKQATKASFVFKHPANCSPQTALLLSDLKQKHNIDKLTERFSLITSGNEIYVSAFILTDGSIDTSILTGYGVKLNIKAGSIYTSLIPVSQLENVLSVKGIEYLEIGHKGEPKLDVAREQTYVNYVHSGIDLSQSYTGEGVIVGIIDEGFDYTHPTFFNADYSQYRISRVWEQKENGTPPENFNYGNELVGQTAILNNANDGVYAGSHGTHVAGIAAGSGSALSASYKGVAYESEIVLVSTTMSQIQILEGIAYIINYANSVNKPCVINVSIGTHVGPHDGTSAFDRVTDVILGEGLILVGSAGNEGSDDLHLSYNFGSNETVFSFVAFPDNAEFPNADSTIIDIWGEADKDFTVALNVYNVATSELECYTDYIATTTDGEYNFVLQDSDPLYSDQIPVTIFVEHSNPINNKPHVFIKFDNTDQNESGDISEVVLLEINSSNTSFDAWCNSGIFSDLGYSSPFINGDANSTIGEIGGTGNSIISVGAYNSTETVIGNIASFSSKGPTADGRIKPDISAPGNRITSSVNSFDSNYLQGGSGWNDVVTSVTNGTIDWYFARMQGTSMASPLVAGIVALWLEADPTLTPSEIKQLMQNNSLTFGTGSVPNNTWGYGKIDAHETIKAIELAIGVYNLNESDNLLVFPNPSAGEFVLKVGDETMTSLQIFDISGKLVYSEQIENQTDNKTMNLQSLTNGIYILKLSNNKYTKQTKLLINK